MRFYTNTHAHYCGIDLHAKTMYLCILDRDAQILLSVLTIRPQGLGPVCGVDQPTDHAACRHA